MSELVKRLRELAPHLAEWEDGEKGEPTHDDALCLAAAAEIERLTRERDQAREAVKVQNGVDLRRDCRRRAGGRDAVMTRDELNELLRLHERCLNGGTDGQRAYLEDANLAGAYLADAKLAGANLEDAYLAGVTGNMAEIKSLQIEQWPVAYTADRLQIGGQNHAISRWRNMPMAMIERMDPKAADWWRKWKPTIFSIIDASPATPTGHEGTS